MKKKRKIGQWLWHSWQHGRFRYQRSWVRIQSLATFIKQLIIYFKQEEEEALIGKI